MMFSFSAAFSGGVPTEGDDKRFPPPVTTNALVMHLQHRRNREPGEIDAAIRLEPGDRLDQSDRRRLCQVGRRLATPGVPAGQMPRQRQPRFDRPRPQRGPGRITSRQTRQRPNQLIGAVRHHPVGDHSRDVEPETSAGKI
jgi:hypothetical protein